MGAKASTATGNSGQSPRTRTFSTSSSSDVVSSPGAGGFSLLRALPGVHIASVSDRQRARSLSSVPDLHSAASHEAIPIPPTHATAAHHHHHHHHNQQQQHQQQSHLGAGSPDTDSSSSTTTSLDEAGPSPTSAASAAANIAIGRVFAAHSLPSHIWSLNSIKCPVCSKFVLPDEIEFHLVLCLTKPRLSYNEDILKDDKGECVICLEDLQQGDTIARLPCLCIYHKKCIDQWFEVNRCCPEHPGD